MLATFDVAVERPVYDRYGTPIAPTPTHVVEGCFDEPVDSTEVAGSSIQTTTRRVLHAPVGADVRQDDTIIYPDGSRWHAVGQPYDWSNPFTGRRFRRRIDLEWRS